MAVGVFNKLRAELKTLFETGFIQNSVQFFGTGAGKILTVNDYLGNEVAFSVYTKKTTTGAGSEYAYMTPYILIESLEIDDEEKIGGSLRYLVTVKFNVALALQHYKNVGGEDLKEEDLSLWLEEQFRIGLRNCTGRFTTIRVSNIDLVPADEHTGNIGSSPIFGFKVAAVFKVSSL